MDRQIIRTLICFITSCLLLQTVTVNGQTDGFIFLINNDKVMLDIVNAIDKSMIDMFDNSVKPHIIEKELDKIDYQVKDINSTVLKDEFVDGIEKLFQSKTSVLENIRTSAENAEMAHDYTKAKEEGPYFNMRDIVDKYNVNQSVKIFDTFSGSVKVNMTHSFVQVPTNVYAYKSSVLQQVDWAQKIDETFERNFNQSNKTLLWQFYGDSATGIFRIFPGNIIAVKEDKTDLYDCRRRIWYIQAAASAKDVVILLDVSGSMIGNNIGIAKIAISSLLDTLQENDYFNIVLVNKEAKYLVPCITYLIQATKENKEMMKQAIQSLNKATNIIDVDKGMDKAFEVLNSGPKYNRTSAECNQAIMFISDGIEGDYAGKASIQRNNQNKRVRIFSYLVGRVKNPDKKALIKMSCDNGGHYYHIETLGNIWDTVLDYLRVMSRPITEKFDNSPADIKPSYSPAYLDSAGFGMIMSISLSVFKKRVNVETRKDFYKEFLGVAGTDISLKNLKDQIELSKLGVFSRGFVINNNGFILIHPHFRDQTGYLPAPPNILMDELEYSKEEGATTNLKKAMLDKKEVADTSFPTYHLYDSNRKIYEAVTSYTYKDIPNTDFVASVGIVGEDKKYLTVKSTTPGFSDLIKQGIEALNVPEDTFDYAAFNLTKTNTTYATIAPWNYCQIPESETKQTKGIKQYPTAVDIYKLLTVINNIDIYKYCSQELIDRLLVMAASADKGASEAWKDLFVKPNGNVSAVFVATISGYQKFYSFHENHDPTPPFSRNVLHTQLFETPTAHPEITYLFTAPVRDNSKPMTNEPVSVTVTKQYRKNGLLAAVSGFQLNSTYLNDLIVNSATFTTQSSIKYDYCKINTSAVCALIDDHGYIIASNQNNKYTGHFIGERLGGIIGPLQSQLNFKKIILDDTQAECPISDEPSAANILLTPAKILFTFISSLFKSLFWITVQFGIFIISLFQFTTGEEPMNIRISCTKEMPFYKTNISKIEPGKQFKGIYNCPACQNMKFIMQRLADTNLILLIAETSTLQKTECDCFSDKHSLRHVRKESKIDWCNPPKQNFRKKPSSCFNATLKKDEEKKACGAAFTIQPSLLTIFFITIALIYYMLE